jgi:hypoxanthine phosphoribosyltransferase
LELNYWAEYIGFFIPDKFVIGYGLDYNEKFRDIMHLCVLNDAGIEKFKV